MEPRDLQRILYAGFLVFAMIVLFIVHFFQDKNAKQEGYVNYAEKQNTELAEQILEDYKFIRIYSDETMTKENLLTDVLEADGYRVSVDINEKLSYLSGEMFNHTKNKDVINIINGCSEYDFLYNTAFEKMDREAIKNSILLSLSNQERDVIVIISPNYNFTFSDELNYELDYETYIDILIEACEENNIDYINLYEYTKQRPYTINDDGVEKYNDDTYNYIYSQLSPLIGQRVNNKKEEIRKQLESK